MTRRSATKPSRWDSARLMPGLYCMPTSSVPSLNGGRNARGSSSRAGCRQEYGGDDRQDDDARMVEGPIEKPLVSRLEDAHEEAVLDARRCWSCAADSRRGPA